MLKGKSLKNGDRVNILNIKLYRKFKRETGIDIEYRDFSTIISMSNKLIGQRIINNVVGFKLPAGLGRMFISEYKDKRKKIDWKRTKELGKYVYHNNFASGGRSARLVWIVRGVSNCKHVGEYKFYPDRNFTTLKSKALKSGKRYTSYNFETFYSPVIKKKLDKLLYG